MSEMRGRKEGGGQVGIKGGKTENETEGIKEGGT